MIDPYLTETADQAVRDLHELIGLGLTNKDAEFDSILQYPPIKTSRPMSEEEFFKDYSRPKDEPLTIYAHIPFCIKQCIFCHVPNIIAASDAEKDLYLDNLIKEMDLWMRRLGVSKLKARSILLGGGTPTHLTPAQLERFLKAFTSRIETDAAVQFSCDLDPLTVIGHEGRERLKIMKAFGVTRLSMGAQSFSDEILKNMNRHHNAADTVRAIGQVKEMGFKQEIEFIYGYPGDTREQWVSTLKQALSYDLDEIMIYRLKIIPNVSHKAAITALLDKRGDLLTFNEEAIRFKAIGYKILEDAGYRETVERSFTRQPGLFSNYRNDFMGCQNDTVSFGYYALTMFRDRFAQKTRDLGEYNKAVGEGRIPLRAGLIRNRDQQLRRNILMPLENRGLPKKQFQDITGLQVREVFGKKIDLLKKYGLLEETAEFLNPTHKGRFFIDDVTQFFYHPDLLPFPREKYNEGPLNPYIDNAALDAVRQ